MGIQIPDGYVDITPTMTSNNTPSGYTASASSTHETWYPWHAFDGVDSDASNVWRVWHSSGGMPQWIMLEFPNAVKVDLFSITNRANFGDYDTRGITSFELQGSNDGSAFTALGSYTRGSDFALTTLHEVQNPGKYRFYRIYVTGAGYTFEGVQYAVIEQIRFYTTSATSAYENVNGVLKKMIGGYENVGGVSKKLLRGYQNIGGVLKLIWEDKTSVVTRNPLGSLAVGSVVKMNVGGVSRNFIVVNQGLPSSVYDSSCDGTWLLMGDIYELGAFDSNNTNSYSTSTSHLYLNSTFLDLLDSDIKSAVKTVKIPYTYNSDYDGYVASGSSGLSAQVFLLSYVELGFIVSVVTPVNAEGAALGYFNGADNSKRIGYLNGTATMWLLRSPYISSTHKFVWYVSTNGGASNGTPDYANYGIRPALVLPSDTVYVDENMNVII